MIDQPSTAIIWFRRDLRLADNPALAAAAHSHDQVLPLFVVDPKLWKPAGANRRAFLAGCLEDLDHRTAGHLVVRCGDPARVVADLTAETESDGVYCAEDFGPYGVERDDAVETALAAARRPVVLERIGSPYAVPPGTLHTQSGGPFKVFTPFAKAWRHHGWDDPIHRPRNPNWVAGVRSDGRPAAPRTDAHLPEPGEKAAKRRLDDFLEGAVHHYAERRDKPGEDGTSRLSPYLKWGCPPPGLGPSRPEQGRADLCHRALLAGVLRRRLVPPSRLRPPCVQPVDERHDGRSRKEGR